MQIRVDQQGIFADDLLADRKLMQITQHGVMWSNVQVLVFKQSALLNILQFTNETSQQTIVVVHQILN